MFERKGLRAVHRLHTFGRTGKPGSQRNAKATWIELPHLRIDRSYDRERAIKLALASYRHWKEIESSQPEDQTSPTPNSGSTNPEDWTPSWSKRTQVVFEAATQAFYKGGFLQVELPMN